MRVWVAKGFDSSVRRLFSKEDDQKTVYKLLSDYADCGDDRFRLTEFEKENTMKKMKGCASVKKCYITGTDVAFSRLIFLSLDHRMAAALREPDRGIDPRPGDVIAVAVSYHEVQGEEARRIERRFWTCRQDVVAIEPFVPPEQDHLDENAVKKGRIEWNSSLYASKIPFNDYNDYLKFAQGDSVLSKEQFDCLQDIFRSQGVGCGTPFLVSGCAGSGKTLLTATVLHFLSRGESLPNAYFVLSKKLRSDTEALCLRLALRGIRWKAKGGEKKEKQISDWLTNLLESAQPGQDSSSLSWEKALQSAASSKIAGLKESVSSLKGEAPACLTTNETLFNLLLKHDSFGFRQLVGTKSGEPKSFEDAFVGYSRFRKWLGSNSEFRGPELWTEIKGIIKGFLGASVALKLDESRHWHWGRNEFTVGVLDPYGGAEADVVDAAWKILAQHGLAEFDNEDPEHAYWRLRQISSEVLKLASDKAVALGGARGLKVARCISTILSAAGFGSRPPYFVDYRKPGLTQREYVDLPDTQSIHDQRSRRRIHQIFRAYEKWKTANHLVDENDLARYAAAWFAENRDKRPYGTILVDECQDFTEMQLLAMKSLGRNENGMILAGDRHQMINPTFFDPNRMATLFARPDRPTDRLLEYRNLTMNYRNTRQIVGITNRIAAKRKELIGATSLVNEQDERSPTDGDLPVFWADENHQLAEFLERQLDDPTFRILVHDESDKELLSGLLQDPQKKERLPKRTYTVRECKGLEYKKIFCFNLLGKYSTEWSHILARKAEHDERYRYFFNAVYVAATRAIRLLCFYEPTAGTFNTHQWLWASGFGVQPTAIPHDAWPVDAAHVVRDAISEGDKEWKNADDDDPKKGYENALDLYRQARQNWRVGCGIRLDVIEQRIVRAQIALAQLESKDVPVDLLIDGLMNGAVPEPTVSGIGNVDDPYSIIQENRKQGNWAFMGLSNETITRVIEVLSTRRKGRRFLDEIFEGQLDRISQNLVDFKAATEC